MSDKLHEECGIFGGCCKSANILPIIRDGLIKLQHRGQESAGVFVCGANFQNLYKDLGFVKDVFENLPKELKGNCGIGHVRYSTQMTSEVKFAQPFLCKGISVAHNGNISDFSGFNGKSDTENLLESIIAEVSELTFEGIGKFLDKKIKNGAYSIVFCLNSRVFAYRDKFGFRPLFFCEADEGYFVGSEDIAFSGLKVIKIIEIKAGFGVEITENGYEIKRFSSSANERKCVFEPIYFSSPKSNVFGLNIGSVRENLGKILAESDTINADVVMPVPKSGNLAGKGYSEKSGIKLVKGILLKDDVVRSFIQPTEGLRKSKIDEKFEFDRNLIKDKTIILVDDSIVRGTTSKEIVRKLRTYGAKAIHLRLS